MVTARTNKLLGLFRRICSMLTDAKVRRSLYLAAVKSKMNYATEVCFLSHSTFKQKAERVQRRASCWILKNQARWTFLQRETDSSGSGTLDREVKDVVFCYKALYGYIDIDVSFIMSASHGHTRWSRSSDLKYLETPFCKTATYQS